MNIKTIILLGVITMLIAPVQAENYKPAGDKMMTRWGKQVTPQNAWTEYPRPQMKRTDWQNLNGLWQYAITHKDAAAPLKYEGEILVPFCAESALSGVGKSVLPSQMLWYERAFTVSPKWNNKRIILHFDAADWQTTVWVNGKKIGGHKGGSDPFSFDITAAIKQGKPNTLKVSVWDPSDEGTQPRGKQKLAQGGIWYTPVTGIWQTVWIEPVSKTSLASVVPVADIDHNRIELNTALENATGNETVEIVITQKGEQVVAKTMQYTNKLTIDIPSPELWSPGNPALYNLSLTIKQGSKTTDKVDSYFAMRKISKVADTQGNYRFNLNNRPLFLYGPLDQGWWPDGLLTPPGAEAMRWDMETIQQMGFNMLRKHIKVEPSLYYYYADSMGLIVWQDMVSGFKSSEKNRQHVMFDFANDWDADVASSMQYKAELKQIMDHLAFFPSVAVWTIFNEGWGQHQTKETVEWAMKYDPTRIIDGVSGWTDRNVGDMYDVHFYPYPGMPSTNTHPGRMVVLGEFGGLGYTLKDHIWNAEKRNWGYATMADNTQLIYDYSNMMFDLVPMINDGLASAVYTQTTDVEAEVNGLITYDREIVKMDPGFLSRQHAMLYTQKSAFITTLVADNQKSGRVITAKNNLITLSQTDEKRVSGSALFETKEMPKNLFLRIYTAGVANIWLNDKLIGTTHALVGAREAYNVVNLTNFAHWVQPGTNTIRVEAILKNKDNNTLDFGLFAY